jgi:hypothetical protein
VDFTIPAEIQRKLEELDAFIEREIAPLQAEHPEYFDHRREFARTDWENGGRPRPEGGAPADAPARDAAATCAWPAEGLGARA